MKREKGYETTRESAKVGNGVFRRFLNGFHKVRNSGGGIGDLVHAHLKKNDRTWVREVRGAGVCDGRGGLCVQGVCHRGDGVPDGGVRAEERRIEVGDWHIGVLFGV